jgi:hypothetical protein
MRALAILMLAVVLAGCSRKPHRVELEPGSLRFFGRGQRAKVHATPWASTGRPMPDQPCDWSSSDEKVALVVGKHNDAIVTSAGPGTATIRCEVHGKTAELPVSVRVVAKLSVKPAEAELKIFDTARPLALQVEAWDDLGTPVAGRVARTRCADEAICRGDARGQLWAVGAGQTKAIVEVEGASAEIAVRVVDARTAAGRPQRVTVNPMLELERQVQERDAAAAKAAP